MTETRLQNIEDGVEEVDVTVLVNEIRRLKHHVKLLAYETKMTVGRIKDSVAIDRVLPLNEQLIQCLIILRYLYDITDYQVAVRSDTCRTTVRRIANGDISTTLVTLDKIMKSFPRHAIQLSVVEVDPEENGVDDEEITSD